MMEREREAVVWRGEVQISAYSFGWRVACAAACGEGERESRPALGVWDGGRERREEESYTSWSLKKSRFVARVTR